MRAARAPQPDPPGPASSLAIDDPQSLPRAGGEGASREVTGADTFTGAQQAARGGARGCGGPSPADGEGSH